MRSNPKELREHLLRKFDVNLETGQIIRRSNGKVMECLDSYGYIQVSCGTWDGKRLMMKGHQIVYLVTNGYLPETVDHRDRVKTNNKPSNLRAATWSMQARNKDYGDCVRQRGPYWRAAIRDGTRQIERGFKSKEAALRWRRKMEATLWQDV